MSLCGQEVWPDKLTNPTTFNWQSSRGPAWPVLPALAPGDKEKYSTDWLGAVSRHNTEYQYWLRLLSLTSPQHYKYEISPLNFKHQNTNIFKELSKYVHSCFMKEYVLKCFILIFSNVFISSDDKVFFSCCYNTEFLLPM